MTRPNPSTALAEALVDELARNGVRFFVISPGSRSAALAIAADAHPQVETVVVVDERSAAFWALGRAKAGSGAAVVSTSGTAPANWFPAVVEADMSLTPLVLLSADRPAELRGVGANQTIDQVELFGDKVRFFADVPAPEGGDENASWRETACRAMAASRGAAGQPGPVHLNVAFREPTVPVADDGRTRAEPYPHSITGRDGAAPWVDFEIPGPAEPDSRPTPSGRGLVVAGDGEYDREGLLAQAERLGWPVLATALSGLRGLGVVDVYHHLLAGPIPDRLVPEVVLVVGAIGPSDRLEDLVSLAPVRVRVDRWGRSIDPRRNATMRIAAGPVSLLAGVTEKADPSWSETWRDAQARLRSVLDTEVRGFEVWTGAGVVTAVSESAWGCLVVGSSLPIREVDAHFTRRGPVIANRGASGIDGIVSTALGAATAEPRTVLITGDLALFHDANGLLSEEASPLVIVAIDNGGGGLFDSLPTAAYAPSYERLFVTPHHRRLADLARLHRMGHEKVHSTEELTTAVDRSLEIDGRVLLEVEVDRAQDLAARRRLDDLARSALNT